MNNVLFKMLLNRSKDFWIASGFFVIAFFIRTYHLGVPGLYDDEISTAVRIDHSLFDTICYLGDSEFPPLYYVIQNLWVGIWGNGEWALRFLSAFFSSLTIIVMYFLGKELFNRKTGCIAALLLSFSLFALMYAQFAKMYSLFWFLVAGSFLFLFRFLKDQKKSEFRFYLLFSVLHCYTMYAGVLILLTQNLIFFLFNEGKKQKEWLIGQLIILVLYAPWVIYFLGVKHTRWASLRSVNFEMDYFQFLKSSFLCLIGSSIGGATSVLQDFPNNQNLWWINKSLYIGIIVLFLASFVKQSFQKEVKNDSFSMSKCFILLWIVIPTTIYMVFDYFFVSADLGERYIGFIQVPIILLVSSQVNKLYGWIRGVVLVILICVSINNIVLRFNFNHIDWWSNTAEALTQQLGKNDIVLSSVDITKFKYYFKGNTNNFFYVSVDRLSSEIERLQKEGFLSDSVDSIFFLCHSRRTPFISIAGFKIENSVSYDKYGFFYFRRIDKN